MRTVKQLNLEIKKTIKTERKKLISNKMKDSSPATFWHTVNGLLEEAYVMTNLKP